jgi:uncharacterized protein (DUF1778 family)
MVKKLMSPTTTRPPAKSRAKSRAKGPTKLFGKSRAASVCRLEARIPADLYEVMEAAAKLRGLTMTAYVMSVMVSDARHTIEESSIIKLSRADQTAFAKALMEPPTPNAKLVAAARRHAALIR